MDESGRREALALARSCGVVGAGGAGFPTYAKLSSPADLVIANGAECEPLLGSDQAVMARRMPELLDGLTLAMALTGASRGVLAVKGKHAELCRDLESAAEKRANVSLFRLGNYYPAGDEVVLVHAVTGRSVPGGGLPRDVGVVVQNVTTLVNLAAAARGVPVTTRYVTVAGEVGNPGTYLVPVGTSFDDLIARAGGTTAEDCRILVGGPMMGKLADPGSSYVAKTTGGLIVLPSSHPLVASRLRDLKLIFSRTRSVCCQCNYCTLFCPRYLVGHELKPHALLRSLSGGDYSSGAFDAAFLCTECGACEWFSCVQGISPAAVNAYLKERLRENGRKSRAREEPKARAEIEDRRISAERLMVRIGADRYAPPPASDGGEGHFPVDGSLLAVNRVRIALRQHIGSPCAPSVSPGDKVEAGDVVGRAPTEGLGADVHASIPGVVTEVGAFVAIEGEKSL